MNVQPRRIFRKEIDRFVFNLEKKKFPPQDVEKARSLHREPFAAHVFYFGNRKDSYHHGIGLENYPCITEEVVIKSWMLNRFIHAYPTPTAFLGDATGTSHPLAAIGAYLSFKHSVDLLKYCILTHNLKNVESPHKSRFLEQALRWTESKMALDRLMVFLQARLCHHYSRY